jgi:hypothetical protein
MSDLGELEQRIELDARLAAAGIPGQAASMRCRGGAGSRTARARSGDIRFTSPGACGPGRWAA